MIQTFIFLMFVSVFAEDCETELNKLPTKFSFLVDNGSSYLIHCRNGYRSIHGKMKFAVKCKVNGDGTVHFDLNGKEVDSAIICVNKCYYELLQRKYKLHIEGWGYTKVGEKIYIHFVCKKGYQNQKFLNKKIPIECETQEDIKVYNPLDKLDFEPVYDLEICLACGKDLFEGEKTEITCDGEKGNMLNGKKDITVTCHRSEQIHEHYYWIDNKKNVMETSQIVCNDICQFPYSRKSTETTNCRKDEFLKKGESCTIECSAGYFSRENPQAVHYVCSANKEWFLVDSQNPKKLKAVDNLASLSLGCLKIRNNYDLVALSVTEAVFLGLLGFFVFIFIVFNLLRKKK